MLSNLCRSLIHEGTWSVRESARVLYEEIQNIGEPEHNHIGELFQALDLRGVLP